MINNPLLEQSSRIALAALLHDLGKFAERAKIDVHQESLAQHKQMYCPHHKKYDNDPGWYSHVHAAYTALGMDRIETDFPKLVDADLAPFGSWKTQNADDSFVNAAAKHHKPETFLQWIIATADRVASGFDREEFETYNRSEDKTQTGKNHYTARQLSLFEQIRLHGDRAAQTYAYRYPLLPLTPSSVFPVLAKTYETHNDQQAQAEYLNLWNGFTSALKDIPSSHRINWSLWLDHFETLWGVYTQAIPAATAFNIRPDVSLYDHSRITAALATALWRYHHERQESGEATAEKLRKPQQSWQEHKFLLVQGDFFGIQDFIFGSGGESNKRAAKLLRGRSFYVSLLAECAALNVLDTLDLPSTSQVINAAGKFMIVAPNTPDTLAKLHAVQQSLDQWFLAHSFGQAGVGLAWVEASCNDFCRQTLNDTASPYQRLIKKLFEIMELKKCQRFNLCDNPEAPTVFEDFLSQFHKDMGVCQIDGKTPAKHQIDAGTYVGDLAHDQIEAGHWLTRRERILITRQSLGITSSLKLPIFGYHICFVDNEEGHGKFGEQARNGNLLRAWDFSLPQSADQPLWTGYARRYINAYVPKVGEKDLREADYGKYINVDEQLEFDSAKTMNHLACDDRQPHPKNADGWIGISALSTLKGDVDNLGAMFQTGLGHEASFSKTAALSRQINAFFSIYLPWLCRSEFPNSYTVFAGGDDFFLIGPWYSQIKLAQRMRQDFKRYVVNDAIHFSAGISTTKPGLPIGQLAEMAEEGLESAKRHNPQQLAIMPKNAVSCFNQHVFWDELDSLLNQRLPQLQQLSQSNQLSTGYVYGLLNLIDMAEHEHERPQNALWRSYFAYRTARMLDRQKLGKDERQKRLAELASEISENGIKRHQGNYRVALFCHLYQQRD